MAVASPSPSKNHKVTNSKAKKRRKEEAEHQNESETVMQESSCGNQSPPSNGARKRAKNRGIRMVGARIYDSENGKSCHQCRQKTMDFVAECTKMKDNGKHCTRKCCFKCLENRYGENAEEMQALGTWICPSCRGICNCSQCMLKKGQQPTGIMAPTAKKAGFSVSQMLQTQGSESLRSEKITENESGLTEKGASNKNHGKESFFDGTGDPNLQSQPLVSCSDVKKPKKVNKGGGSKGNQTQSSLGKSITKGNEENIDAGNPNVPSEKQNDDFVPNSVSDPVAKYNKKKKQNAGQMDVQVKADKLENGTAKVNCQNDSDIHQEVTMPQGRQLTKLAGTDLSPEDAGNALQFLEFCAAFGEILGIKKGQAESVLRDVMSRRGRRGKCSSHVQLHIQLLNLIQKDSGEESPSLSTNDDESSWLLSLKNYLAESDCVLKDMHPHCFDKGLQGYESLSSSEKLRLLTFLCDETLCTMEMRNWMEEQESKFVENQKEVREMLKEARDKVKILKQKKQDEIAKAIIAKSGGPLSVSEYQSIVSEIKAESAKAHAEMMKVMDMVPKYKSRSDAVRTDPIFLSGKGHAFWKLKAYDQSIILLQDIGGLDLIMSNDKWFSFDDDDKKDVEKYISTSSISGL